MARILGVSYKEVKALEKDAEWGHISSTETPVGDDEITLGELLPGCEGIEDDIIEEADREALKGILWPMVDELPGQQSTVIRARFKDELTLKEVGEMIGGAPDRAKQVGMKALGSLENHQSRSSGRTWNSISWPMLFNGCGVDTFNRTWTSSTERTALRGDGEIVNR